MIELPQRLRIVNQHHAHTVQAAPGGGTCCCGARTSSAIALVVSRNRPLLSSAFTEQPWESIHSPHSTKVSIKLTAMSTGRPITYSIPVLALPPPEKIEHQLVVGGQKELRAYHGDGCKKARWMLAGGLRGAWHLQKFRVAYTGDY